MKSVTVNTEHSMLFSSDYRSIRLDVYSVDAEGNHYNVEMQGENKGDLPKRSRFHQAEMDALGLYPGEDFDEVFVSTKGTNVGEVPAVLVNFLRYVENSTDACVEELDDDVVRLLHERIKRIKESREWERRYMRFEELLRDKYKEGCESGREEGRVEGATRMLALTVKMTEAGEADKIPQLTDKAFLEEMYRKYEL